MSTRPGGRSARIRDAVLEAVHAELVDRGYLGMTVENVADRAGVHKTTVYRRWGTVDVLIADALDRGRDVAWTAPDTGSAEGDLIALAHEVVDTFTDPVRSRVPIALVAAALQSSRARQAKHDYYAARHAAAAGIVERAVERGELPPRTDPAELVRQTCAPLFYRVFVSGEPLDRATGERAARAALAAARAGVL
ncbi:TetR/AcrR family transcriptional regulator [Saccharothrix lopnurensis]|uniref:TetR/AcrR family transcriptional regulator n=1 Tax=Saccharothrix lopnurensis TaxID=1670621 RepID=A0ABW1PD10_9PSEU